MKGSNGDGIIIVFIWWTADGKRKDIDAVVDGLIKSVKNVVVVAAATVAERLADLIGSDAGLGRAALGSSDTGPKYANARDIAAAGRR
ncbi:hypothetical protein SDJN03_19626, partial [Cucurbita argyrosperma subsp. sororia]